MGLYRHDTNYASQTRLIPGKFTFLKQALTVKAFNPDTDTLLDTQVVDEFQNGAYLQYYVKGHIKFQLVGNNAKAAVLSGVFFGYENAVSFLGKDTTTSGNWKGVY